MSSPRNRRVRYHMVAAFLLGAAVGPASRIYVGVSTIRWSDLLLLASFAPTAFRRGRLMLVVLWRRSPLLLASFYLMALAPLFVGSFSSSPNLVQQIGLLFVPLQWILALSAGFGFGRNGYFAKRSIIWFVLGLFSINMLFVATQSFDWVAQALPSVASWDRSSKLALGGLGFGRPTGSFANANELSACGLIGLAVSASLTRRRGSALALVSLFLLAEGGSRGYLFGAIAAALILHRAAFRSRSRHRFLVLAVAAMCLFATTNIFLRLSDVIEQGSSSESVAGRLLQARDLGGHGSLWMVVGYGRPPGIVAGGSVDSDWLYLSALYGIPLTALFVAGVWIVVRSTRNVTSPEVVLLSSLHLSIQLLFWALTVAGFAQLGIISLPGVVLFFLIGVSVALRTSKLFPLNSALNAQVLNAQSGEPVAR